MEDNQQIITEQLTSKVVFKSSDTLTEQIMEKAEQSNPSFQKKCSFKKIFITAVSAAAVLAAIVILRPFLTQAYSAGTTFNKASDVFSNVSACSMEIFVRTLPDENFSYIDVKQGFVKHTLINQPSTKRWSLEKPGRKALFDGTNTWLWQPSIQTSIGTWTPDNRTGTKFPGNSKGILEDFVIYTEPFLMMSLEAQYIRLNPKALIKKEKNDSKLTILIDAPAIGNFENDFCKNTNLEETDTRREYVFDLETNRLLTVKIDAIMDGKSTTVLEIKNIQYDYDIDSSTFEVPKDVEWMEYLSGIHGNNSKTSEFVGIIPERAIEKAFAAMESWDEETLKVVMAQYNLKNIKSTYAGCRLLSHKIHFRSGRYAGVFIPCTIQFANGEKVNRNIAIRNDNKEHVWLIDGGI